MSDTKKFGDKPIGTPLEQIKKSELPPEVLERLGLKPSGH